jgi:DNA-binding transcriptional LysR family regulator
MSKLPGLSLRHLRAFAATIRTGTVTAAAQALHVTPPAISSQLKLVERIVGAPILLRTATGFEPTELGLELLDLATEIESLIDRTDDRIAALRSGAAGSLILGVVSTAKYFSPRLVAAFQRAHPQIRVKLLIGNRSEIIQGLERRDYDVAIMGRPPAHLDLACEVLGDHPYWLIAPPGHPLVGDRDVLPEDLLRETFLTREQGSGTRLLMERFLERIGGGRPFTLVEMGTNETIKQAVMAGLGIAILSGHTCHVEVAEHKLATIPGAGLPLVRQWFLIHRSDRPLSRVGQVFRHFVLDNKATIFPAS